MQTNISVYAALCASAERVDDARQRFVISPDATIRYVTNDDAESDMCLTTANPVGLKPSTEVYLYQCLPDSLQQHWAFHGLDLSILAFDNSCFEICIELRNVL